MYALPVASESVHSFRAHYRATEIGAHYTGWGHFALTSTVCLGTVAFALTRLAAPTALEWLTVPATFLLANLVEYWGHRGPMHHRTGPKKVYERHTLQHHRFFTHESMAYEGSRDFKMVLFPPVLLGFFLGAIAAPIGALLFVLATPNIAWLYVATAMGYFLTYEWLHFAYHLPTSSPLARLPGLAFLRRHHTLHHDPAQMGKANFNITFPVADLLFGTRR